MKIIKIISKHKHTPKITEKGRTKVKPGFERIEAIIEDNSGFKSTKHIDIKKTK